jgi:hypothetical protein
MFKEILGNAFPIIEKVAPVIASALGSPFNGAAAMFGINLLAHAFGINPSNVNELSDAILSHPDSHDKLSRLEDCFAEWFENNQQYFKLPTKAEFNIKLEW